MRKQILLLLALLLAIILVRNGRVTPTEPVAASTAGTNLQYLPVVSIPEDPDWPTLAGNPQRTSWSEEEVADRNLQLAWYRPIEAYISQNVQIIATNGLLYIATANGLYALNAQTGATVWRFDTALPLGNSPTVANGIVYVGGYDHKLHALDAKTGAHLWAFSEANAGYDTNPLVVNGKVILGNRDGYMYAIGAHNTPQAGQLIWKFQAGGPIRLTAAYHNNAIYFAASDNHAYALNVNTGALIWKSARLPGEQYQSYWPVIYQDKVVFSAASPYRTNLDPGTLSVKDASGNGYGQHYYMDRDDLFGTAANGTEVGPTLSNPPAWTGGNPAIDAANLLEYLEDDPSGGARVHKPWRRVLIILNQSDGSEYTFDSDGDGHPEYAPIAMWGTQSGNRYPPIIGNDGILYTSNIYKKNYISQGRIMGWNINDPDVLSVLNTGGAVDEPQALSAGGGTIYRSICCDRVGNLLKIDGSASANMWDYNKTLETLAPNYDIFWETFPGLPRVQGWYKSDLNSSNGIYHNHGDQNPIVPYQGMVFIHRSNAIVAFGVNGSATQLPTLAIQAPTSTAVAGQTLTAAELSSRLETEVQKILNAGNLRPGYYNAGQFRNTELADYFVNPGDTLYTLTRAYPYLSPSLQTATETYLKDYFATYFSATMYARVGWSEGAPRDAVMTPPEVSTAMANSANSTWVGHGWAWSYPQVNFYAMWKYAALFPGEASQVYALAKQELEVPVTKDAAYFVEKPWQLNGFIAGYIGFLNLQELSGMAATDAGLRTAVTNELNRLKQMRLDIFSKDSPWPTEGGDYHYRTLNLSRNFIMLVPELGDFLQANIGAEVATALNEYEAIAPYWFVTRYNAVPNEGVMQNLYDHHGMFQAKAYIMNESRAELTPYLDAPAFLVGDLFYIQNLIAALDAP